MLQIVSHNRQGIPEAEEQSMGIVSIPKRKTTETEEAGATESRDWVNIAAGGSLMAGGLLLLTGQRRAGLVASMAGAALTLLGQQDMVREWWQEFPGYVDQVQKLVGRVQNSMEDLAATRDNLHQALTGTGK
jgi:4-amino-4-deoxy-L-arabinose transferase-like glycosyltransferase